METVFILHHEREAQSAEDCDDVKFIGVFSTHKAAEDVQRELADKPGFRKYPDGFSISECALNKYEWTSGFGWGHATDVQVLEKFFGAYFHQDWVDDHSTWQDVVKLYLNDVDEGERGALHELLEFDLVRSETSDRELGEKVFAWGCYYDPSADGMTVREWLKAVVAQIASK
jgi:hypothetical protein